MHPIKMACSFALLSHLISAISNGQPSVAGAEFPAKTQANASALVAEACPVDVGQVTSYQRIIPKCSSGGNTDHCCETLIDMMKLFLFSWLRTTGSFLLPNESMSNACLEEFRRQLRANGIQNKILMDCKLEPQQFVWTSETCNKIHNISGFEKAVNTSEIRRGCYASPSEVFHCGGCIESMAIALNQLIKPDTERHSFGCLLFVVLYAGGAVNYNPDLGPDGTYCLLPLIDRQSLPPVAALWPYGNQQHRHSSEPVKGDIVVALSVGIIVAVALSSYVCLRWRQARKLRMKRKRRRDSLKVKIDAGSGLVFFPLSQIKAATGNFSERNVIGEGGFSTIYRGTLSNASEMAVKRFKDFTFKGDVNFLHEVQVISRVRHRNLLPLKGYCMEEDSEGEISEQLLVYEFMANGSLEDYLFSNEGCLSWPERHKIAVGIARGLAYLQEDANPAIIHRDVKAANILLDAELNPLVADFGLAKFKPDDHDDKTHYTTRAVGTLGYVAPEYALYGHLTDKSDVFSFGMVVLELMTGRKVLNSASGNVDHILISDWACDLMQKGRFYEVIDRGIRESGPIEHMERVIWLALQCAHPRVSFRPSISQALAILERIDQPLPDMIGNDDIQLTRREELSWLLSATVERTVSDGSTAATLSTVSCYEGR